MKVRFFAAILLIVPGASMHAADVATGLVAYLPFDGHVEEVIGLGNDGVNHGTGGGDDRTGQPDRCRVFGNNQYVTVPRSASIEPAHALTVSAWVYPTSYNAFNQEQAVILCKRYALNSPLYNSYILMVDRPTGKVLFSLATGGAETALYSTDTLPLNTWTHITATYDGSAMKLHLNGNPSGQMAKSGAMTYSGDHLYIGLATPSRTGQRWEGRIDDVRLYNRALTAEDIGRLADAGGAILTGHYRMNGTGVDSSGHHPPAAFHGNPTFPHGPSGQTAYWKNQVPFYLNAGSASSFFNSQKISLSCLVKLDPAMPGNSMRLFSVYDGGQFEAGDLHFRFDRSITVQGTTYANALAIQYGTGFDQGHSRVFNANLPFNQWVRLTALLDSTQASPSARSRVFVNGAEITAAVLTEPDDSAQNAMLGNSSLPLILGGVLPAPSVAAAEGFSGGLDEVEIRLGDHSPGAIEQEQRQLTGLRISGPPSVLEGNTAPFTVTAQYSSGPERDVTGTATLRCPDGTPEFGDQIQFNLLGSFAPNTPKPTVVTASYTENGLTKSASRGIQMMPKLKVSLRAFVTPLPLLVGCNGANLRYVADVTGPYTGPLRYDWDESDVDADFDNDTGSTNENNDCVHLPGTKLVGVRVTDLGNAGQTASTHIYVTVEPDDFSTRFITMQAVSRSPDILAGHVLDKTGAPFVFSQTAKNTGLVVLTHGWTDCGTDCWIQTLATQLENSFGTNEKPNIAIFDWREMSHPLLFFGGTLSTGADLYCDGYDDNWLIEKASKSDLVILKSFGIVQGQILAEWMKANLMGGNIRGDKPIHIIGHSAGGFVASACMQAVKASNLLKKTNNSLYQVTTLDTPLLERAWVEDVNHRKERYVSSLGYLQSKIFTPACNGQNDGFRDFDLLTDKLFHLGNSIVRHVMTVQQTHQYRRGAILKFSSLTNIPAHQFAYSWYLKTINLGYDLTQSSCDNLVGSSVYDPSLPPANEGWAFSPFNHRGSFPVPGCSQSIPALAAAEPAPLAADDADDPAYADGDGAAWFGRNGGQGYQEWTFSSADSNRYWIADYLWPSGTTNRVFTLSGSPGAIPAATRRLDTGLRAGSFSLDLLNPAEMPARLDLLPPGVTNAFLRLNTGSTLAPDGGFRWELVDHAGGRPLDTGMTNAAPVRLRVDFDALSGAYTLAMTNLAGAAWSYEHRGHFANVGLEVSGFAVANTAAAPGTQVWFDRPAFGPVAEEGEPMQDWIPAGVVSTNLATYRVAEADAGGMYQDVLLPVGAQSIRFEWQFTTPGDGDFLSVHFGTNAVLYLGADLELTRESYVSAEVDVSAFAGQTGRLAFKLNSRGATNAVLAVRGPRLVTVEDGDRDGLANSMESTLGTNPTNPDTDGDGLADGDEVNLHGCDPFLWDTDGDLVGDAEEIAAGTSPLDSGSMFALAHVFPGYDGLVTVQWMSVAGKRYNLHRTPFLGSGSSTRVAESIDATPPLNTLQDTAESGQEQAVYWVEIGP